MAPLLIATALLAASTARAASGCPGAPVPMCSTVELALPASGGVRPGGNPFNASDLVTATVAVSQLSGSRHSHYAGGPDTPEPTADAPGASHAVAAFLLNETTVAVRVTATAPGTYTVTFAPPGGVGADGNDQAGVTKSLHDVPAPCTFVVPPPGAPGADCGFVRVDPSVSTQHFVTSGGNAFFGVGMNLAWVSGATSVEASWVPYLQNLSAHGGNYVRLWLTDSWDDLFLETALGNYSLGNADNIDGVLRAMEQRGMKALMCIESFNLFCDRAGAPCDWDKCVYNAKNGGFLSKPGDFFTDARARAFFKMRLDYLVARYGGSPAVFAWEFFNEVDIADNFSPAEQATWVGEMAPYVASIDPYNHPISTSFCCHNVPEVFTLPSVDFTMTHTYGTHNRLDLVDNNHYWSEVMSAQYSKPTYIAEFGTGAQGAPGSADPTGISLHNGMWAAIMGRGAMTAMSWWWDNWIAPDNLWRHFDGPAKLAGSVAWHRYKWSPIAAAKAQCTDVPPDSTYTCEQQKSWGKCDAVANPWMAGHCCRTCFNCSAACVGAPTPTISRAAPWIRALGMIGTATAQTEAASMEKASAAAAEGTANSATAAAPAASAVVLLWLQNANNTWALQNASAPPSSRAPLVETAGLRVDLNTVVTSGKVPRGTYSVEWLNPYTADVTNAGAVQCGDSTCVLPPAPSFTTDVAAVLRKTDSV